MSALTFTGAKGGGRSPPSGRGRDCQGVGSGQNRKVRGPGRESRFCSMRRSRSDARQRACPLTGTGPVGWAIWKGGMPSSGPLVDRSDVAPRRVLLGNARTWLRPSRGTSWVDGAAVSDLTTGSTSLRRYGKARSISPAHPRGARGGPSDWISPGGCQKPFRRAGGAQGRLSWSRRRACCATTGPQPFRSGALLRYRGASLRGRLRLDPLNQPARDSGQPGWPQGSAPSPS